MGDHFEDAMQRIARRSNGGEKTINDIFDLAVAGNRDAEERHERLERAFGEHCEGAGQRDSRLAKVEAWQEDASLNCAERVKRLINEEHQIVHAAHMAAEHAPRRRTDREGDDHRRERRIDVSDLFPQLEQEREHWLMWMVGSKVGGLILQIAAGVILVLATMYLTGKL